MSGQRGTTIDTRTELNELVRRRAEIAVWNNKRIHHLYLNVSICLKCLTLLQKAIFHRFVISITKMAAVCMTSEHFLTIGGNPILEFPFGEQV